MHYKDQNHNLICILHRAIDWNTGLNFVTEDSEFIQLGTWWYDKGKKLDRHYHNAVERTAGRTNECVHIVQGSMRVDLYDCNLAFTESFIMLRGDSAVFLSGGHGYEMLENQTKVLETKNGPFLGVAIDKTRF
jgi:hypothetical protein